MSYSRSPQLLISSEALTTMDTNTNVTNSPSASVNPTAVPCGQCNITTNTQNPLSIKHNLSNIGYKPQLSHNVISKQQSSYTTSISSMIETNVHGNRGSSINQYPLNEIHTLPRVIEQQSTTNYRPILISNTSITNIGQLKGHTIANHITGNNLPIGNLTYQMIAYPRQALNIQQQQQQQHGKSSHTISTGSTVTNSNNNNNNNSVMLAGVITPECLTADSSHNAARIAQLLAPSGTHSTTVTPAHITGNTQFLVYYPQHLNTGAVKVHSIAACPQTLSTTTVTPTLSAPMTAITTTTLLTNTVPSGTGTPTNLSSNHPTLISCKSTPSSTSIQSDDGHSQQPTTVYYTLATNDLIRQLKLSHQAIQIDSNTSPRQQIIQTPSGLMLIQYPQPQQQQQQQQQQQCPTTVNTAFQQHQQHGQNDNTLSRNLMTSSTLSAKHNAQIGVVGCTTGSLIPGNVDSNTLPRHARVEHVQGSSLICTCPPEVHQAIFEQQKKRQQKSMEQNQSAAVILGGITPFSKVGSTSTNTTTGVSSTSLESTECGTATMSRNSTNLVTGVPKENGLLTKNITDKCQDDELINQRRNFPPYHLTNCTLNSGMDTLKKLTPIQSINTIARNPTITNSQCIDEINEKEAHVNYLITLFQALKTSGVQSDSFKEAFERIGLQVNNNTKLSLQSSDSLNKKQGILKTKLYEIEEIKKSIKSFYQIFTEFNTKLTNDLNNCNKAVMKLLNYQQNINEKRFFDLHLETIYNERECLNQSLQEIYKISSSITEQLYDLECIIEQTGNDVLQHRCRITLPYVQTLESRLESIHSTVSVTYGHYPEIQQLLNNREESERKAVEIQKRLLDEQLYQLKDVNEKCKRIKGTILTLKRLAIVNVQNRQRSNSPRRFTHLGGFVNRAAADRGSIERSRLYAAVQTIQPDSEKRLQAIKKQEMLAIQRRRVFSNENISTNKLFFTPIIDKKLSKTKDNVILSGELDKISLLPKESRLSSIISGQTMITESKDEKRAPLAGYSDDSLGSVTTTGSTDSCNNNEYNKINQSYKSYNPDNITSMMDESSDSTLESNQSTIIPIGILKTSTLNTIHNNCNSPNQRNHHRNNNTRGVMFNTIVTVDDGSEVIRLNCTLDNSELNKNKVPPTIDRINSSTPTTTPTSTPTTITERLPRSKISHERVNKSIPQKSNLYTDSIKSSLCTNNNNNNNIETKLSKNLQIKNDNKLEDISSQVNEFSYTPPTPPPRRTSQITQMNIDENGILTGNRQEGENIEIISPISNKRSLPLSTSADANEGVTSPCE